MKASAIAKRPKGQFDAAIRRAGVVISRGLSGLSTHRYERLLKMLLITNSVSVVFFILRLIGAENFRYWFMLWNLVLAWIAPLIALWLVTRLQKQDWRHWSNVILTVLWLGFLPNSFYMVSDLIHVQQTGEISIIFDAVLFASFIFNGFIAGYIGTFLVHRELLHRLSAKAAYLVVAGIFVLCSYAIYLGRVLRWDTWDALLQPAGILFDISDSILNPLAHPQALVITASYTLLIGTFYLLAYELLRALRSDKH